MLSTTLYLIVERGTERQNRLWFVYMYSCLNEIIAFRSVFKDNSLVSLNRTNRVPKPI
jgi:hypothetical protein